MWKGLVGLTGAMCLVTLSAAAIDANTTDARAILLAVFDGQQGSARSLSRIKMSIRDSAGTRERLMHVRSKRFAEGHKRLILIEQPDEVRNTGFLSIDYSARTRTDEQWLYLPKLHRVSRVPDSGKADSFVGSDFSLSDLAGQNPEDYKAALLQASTRVGDEECWHVEATPRDEAVRDATGYSRTELWISKSKLATVQLKAWLADSTRVKYLKASEIRNEGGIWTAHRVQMRTLEGAKLISETLLELLSVDNDAKDVQDGDFNQQRLERGL
jgi:hypothetical protein